MAFSGQHKLNETIGEILRQKTDLIRLLNIRFTSLLCSKFTLMKTKPKTIINLNEDKIYIILKGVLAVGQPIESECSSPSDSPKRVMHTN